MEHIDSQELKNLVSAGYIWLKNKSRIVDDLNVFPVPDGDTGTNMCFALKSVVDELSKIEDIKEVFVEVGLSSTLNISKLKTFLAEDAIIHPYAGEKELRELELDNQAVLAPSILSSYITLPVLVDNLDLSSSIRTRFFVVGPPEVNQEKHNVTALVCVVKERSGALREILEPFEKLDLTLLALESRTSKGKKWECVFYLEFESLGRDQDVSDLVTQLESKCLFVKKLGSFHREL